MASVSAAVFAGMTSRLPAKSDDVVSIRLENWTMIFLVGVYQPPRESHSSTCCNRSAPQKDSESTLRKGHKTTLSLEWTK